MTEFTIPTTQESYDACITAISSKLNQSIPENDAAFVRALAFACAGLTTGLYKVQTQGVKQSMAVSATGTDLDTIGNNFETYKNPGTAYRFACSVASNGIALVPTGSIWIGDKNGQSYSVTASAAGTGVTTFDVACLKVGDIGALSTGDTLSAMTGTSGILSSKATITSVISTGLNVEETESYRSKVLERERSVGGGCNAYDLRRWGREIDGVRQIYPYSGWFVNGAAQQTLYPGDRTVFVDFVDGTTKTRKTQILAEVEAALITDPETGLSRHTLGLSLDQTIVRKAIRKSIYVTVSGVSGINTSSLDAAKTEIETEISRYLDSIFPYVEGLDVGLDRNDTVTKLSLSRQIQDILMSYGGYATDINFGTSKGSTLTVYSVDRGELLRLAEVIWP